jgi:hypothetical protein
MPTHIKCQCGKPLVIPDGTAARKIVCPICRAVVRAPEQPSSPTRAKSLPDAGAPLRPVEEATEVFPEREKPDRKQRRQAKVRRHGLNQVNRALALHYASTFAVYAGIWTAIIAAFLLLAVNLARGDKAEEPLGNAMGFFFCAAAGFVLLAGLIELATFALCLWVPAAGARLLLFGSLGAWVGVLALSIWVFWPDDHRPFALAGAFVVLLGSWTLWLLFLRRLAFYLHQEEIAAETVRMLLRGIFMMLLAVVLVTVAMLYISLIVYVKYPLARFTLVAMAITGFLGLMRIAAATRFFESMLHFLLFPTGILFVFKYLDLIGSVRMVIYRRA